MTKTRDLANLGGGFIQAGTGAEQRTVESKLQDVVSVKDFGAVGDGVTDDTANIQAAIAASQSSMLIFPTGTYKLNSDVTGLNNQTVQFMPGATFVGGAIKECTRVNWDQSDETVLQINHINLNPTGIESSLKSIVTGKGDNTTVKGVGAGFFLAADSVDVNASTKGCLYGGSFVVTPRITRDNIGIDDAAGVIVQNGATVTNARGTDAIYVGRNSTAFPGINTEWITGCTIGANVGYAFRHTGASFTKFDAAGTLYGSSLGETFGYVLGGTIDDTVTDKALLYSTDVNVKNAAFTLPTLKHFTASSNSFGAATVTNQYGFFVDGTLTGATNNYGYYSNITAAAGRWNVYCNGTAASYFAGNVQIGNVTPVAVTSGTEDGCTINSTGAAHLSRDSAVSLWVRRRTTDGALAAFYRDTTQVGTINVTTTNTTYNTTSDYRLKENVTPVVDGITRLKLLKPSKFNFISEPNKTVDGFLAHEAQLAVPESVTGEKDAVDDEGTPVYQVIDHSKLVPLLTAALQEAVSRIEVLENKIQSIS
jgi:hypothetical protein